MSVTGHNSKLIRKTGYVLVIGGSTWLVWPAVQAKGVFYGIFPDKNLGIKASLLVGKAAKKGRKYRRTLVRRKRRKS